MNNLAPMKNCHGGEHDNLNWMLGSMGQIVSLNTVSSFCLKDVSCIRVLNMPLFQEA